MKSFNSRYKLDLCCRVLFLIFFAQVFTIDAMGDTEVIVDGIKYNLASETRTATVIANSYSGNVVIPTSITNDGLEYSVTRIGEEAFKNCSNLTSVTIPASVTSIGSFAFDGCYNLTAVNTTDIAAWCNISFEYSSYSADDYENLTNPLSYAHHLYLNGQEITDLEIPNGVTCICDEAFISCTNFTSVTIPESVTKIGRYAFLGCTGLIKAKFASIEALCRINFASAGSNPLSCAKHLYINGEEVANVVIPNSVTRIGDYAFSGCSNLTSVAIPESVTNIGYDAFGGCLGLTAVNITDLAAWCNISFGYRYGYEHLTVYSNPLFYAHHLYLNGQEITDLVIPESVSNIRAAFCGCSGLTSITIPNSVTSIGDYTFRGCTGLTSIVIPSNVTSIVGYAFSGCTGLISVTINSNELVSRGYDELASLGAIFGPQVKEYVLGNEITSIGMYVFARSKGLKSITIPNSVTKIGNWAFSDCPDLTSVTINSNELTSKTYTSANNFRTIFGPQVKEYTLGDDVKEIGSYAFHNCSELKFITIPESVTSIGEWAFYKCPGLTSVTINSNELASKTYTSTNNFGTIFGSQVEEYILGDAVTSIGKSAFEGCIGLKSITIPNSVASIDGYAFSGCSGLTSITIPNNVTSIRNYTFHGCSGLTSITIGSGVRSIGYAAFSDCSGLTSIKIPDGVTSIGAAAFSGSLRLASIKIPDGVTSIEGLVFANCSGLTSITIPNSVAEIGSQAFYGCSGLKSVTIPNSVASIGVGAFTSCSSLTKAEFASIEILCKITFGDAYANPLSSAKHLYVNGQEVIELVIPQGVTCIGNYAFSGCSGLSSITIPKSVANIGDGAFCGCTGLNTIYSDATIPPSLSSNSFDYDGSTPALYVLSGCKDAYANAQYWNRFNITEHAYVESIEINVPQYDIIVGESKSIDVIILPSTATIKDLYWEIENPEIASIDNGVVTGIKTGTTVITATTTDGTNLSASCTVNVTNPVIALTLDRTSAELMVGRQIILKATCTPSNADDTNVSWFSNNEDVASVNNGVVTAKGLGDAIITARSVNGIEATCKITVVPTPVTSLSLNTTSIDLVKDATYQLVCSITPEDATNKGLVWTSLNSEVASVSDSGLVTAMSTGTTTIIVSSASNYEITASCIVNVTTPVTSIELDHAALELLVDEEMQLIATYMPSDADNAKVVWSTTNDETAIVSQDGYITAKNEGEALITATTTDGTNLSASCQIHVKKCQQVITWSQETLTCQEGGEMIVLDANSNSGLPVNFSSSAPEIVSIFDLGDIVYANPIKEGKTVITAYQQGNYKYEPVESQKEIEVIAKTETNSKTLVAYYSQSILIDGIVTELTNQIAGSDIQVYTQKIESSNSRIDEANHNADVRDSIMNVITQYPDEAESYPGIKPLSASVSDYDAVILVYPIWNAAMAAPVQTFCFHNRDNLRAKSVAFIEYDLFDEAGVSSDAKVLRLSPSNIDDKSDLIRDWLNSEATGILQLMQGDNSSQKEIYDLQGRKLSGVPLHGIFFIDGRKIAK